MRCKDCNTILSDFEATRRNKISKAFVDLCNACYGTGYQAVTIRHDLASDGDDYAYDEYSTSIEDIQIKFNKSIDN